LIRGRGRKGFTLLELVVASLIATIVFFSIPAVFQIVLAGLNQVEKEQSCSLPEFEAGLLTSRVYLDSVETDSDALILHYRDGCTIELRYDGEYVSPTYKNCKKLYLPKTKWKASSFQLTETGEGVKVKVGCGNWERIIFLTPM